MSDIEAVMTESNPWHRVYKDGDKRHIKILGKLKKKLGTKRTISLTPEEYLEFRAIVEMCLDMHHKMYSGASEFMRLKKKINELEKEIKELKNAVNVLSS
jgi:uncharacterized protein YdcH (DUF465 family)